jgi:Rrf2 family protein
MKISTKGRYGLRTLMDIALHQKQGPVPLNDISARQRISAKYLWQVLNPLRTAGLLNVVRGAHGGYALARPPEQITLLDVVSILEGPVSIVDCVVGPETCGRSETCASRSIWDEVNTVLVDALRAISLADVIERQRGVAAAGEYVI